MDDFGFRVPPGYVYQSPYLAAAAPGGLVPLPATQLSHAAAMAAASQFYEYQNVAAAAATYPGTSYNFAEAYPYTSAAAAGMCLKSVQSKDSNGLIHHHQQHNGSSPAVLAHQRLEKALLPPFLPSVLRSNGRKLLEKPNALKQTECKLLNVRECMRERVCTYVCVCVCEKEREREKARKKNIVSVVE